MKNIPNNSEVEMKISEMIKNRNFFNQPGDGDDLDGVEKQALP